MSALPVEPALALAPPGRQPRTAPTHRSARRPLGDPTPLACTLAKAALEAVMGGNSLGMLARWVIPPLRVSLERQGALARSGGVEVPTVRVERVRICRVGAAVAEASVVVSDGTRSRAVAMRLEELSGKWMATVIDVG